MRGRGLDLGCHLKFGPAKFLYLKLVRIAAAADIAAHSQIDTGGAEVCIVGQRKFEIESSKGVKVAGSLHDLVISRVFY